MLTESQSGPLPVFSETLWCKPEGEHFRVKNAPFFIDEISFDDLIAVHDLQDDFFEITGVIAPSKNSTLWLYFEDGDHRPLIDRLLSMGCGVEGGVLIGYFAVNVPGSVDITPVYEAVAEVESGGTLLVDYPSIRHR